MDPILVIGNKNYSSWSLRPWLLLKVKGIAFDEMRIGLYQQDSKAAVSVHSPSGKVPVLRHGSLAIWDSLAICEYIAERWPEKHCWPVDPAARALARSICAEMHSGFATLRSEMPMNCRRVPALLPGNPAEDLDQQIQRIDDIWTTCRGGAASGDFLFGDFGIADAMFAPVVLRFTTYRVPVSRSARIYMDKILALPALEAWIAAARSEAEVVARFER